MAGNEQRGNGQRGDDRHGNRRGLLADHEDPRSDEQRYADSCAVTEQAGAIGSTRENEAYRRRLLRLAQQRRHGRGEVYGEPVLQFDVVPRRADDRPGPGDLVLAVPEMVVRTEDADRALAALDWPYDRVPVDCLRGRVTRLVPREPRALGAVAVDAATLRAVDVHASVTTVVPLGYVAKGRAGAEPSAVDPAYRGPGELPEDRRVCVAVVDTGITGEVRSDGWLTGVSRGGPPNPDRAVEDPLYAFNDDGTTLDLGAGHGTLAAGVVQQVAPEAAIAVYRALDSEGIGDEVRIGCALVQAVADGADVVSLSLGTSTVDDAPPVSLEVALEIVRETAPHVLVVAAAGNSGSTVPVWPAAFPDVVGVAGLTSGLAPAAWSSRGHWVTCSTVGEGVLAPYVIGVELPEVDDPPDEFGPDSWAVVTGTSFAAPQVAGAVARLMRENPTGIEPAPTPRQALAVLLESDPRHNPWYGARRLPDFGFAVRILPGT